MENNTNTTLTMKEQIIRRITVGKESIIIDDHTYQPMFITGVVEFNNPNKDLACCFDADHYCLNACYINSDDDMMHCSMASVGGVLYGEYPTPEQLKVYNDSVCQDGGKIKCFYSVTGDVVYPEGEESYRRADVTEPEKTEHVNKFKELPAHTSSVLTIRLNDGKEVFIAAYKYEILPGALQYIAVDPKVESTYEYPTHIIPLCNIKNIKVESASVYKNKNQ